MKYLKRHKSPTLSMAPMIDCAFLLVIFFTVSTTFAPIQGLPAELPPPIPQISSSIPPIHGPITRNPSIILVIVIDDPAPGETKGPIVVRNGSGEDIIQTGEMFNWFINASEDVKSIAIVQASSEISHKQIAQVIDTVKQIGIDKIGFVRTLNTTVRIIDR